MRMGAWAARVREPITNVYCLRGTGNDQGLGGEVPPPEAESLLAFGCPIEVAKFPVLSVSDELRYL